VRQGQGELVSVEADRSIEVADREMSLEQVSDGNESFRSHIFKDKMHRPPHSDNLAKTSGHSWNTGLRHFLPLRESHP
jgi:hypothetical protein